MAVGFAKKHGQMKYQLDFFHDVHCVRYEPASQFDESLVAEAKHRATPSEFTTVLATRALNTFSETIKTYSR